MEVIEVNHGIANNFGTHVEINKNLKNYPHLLKPIMEHELSHTDKLTSWHDFKLDFLSYSPVPAPAMLKFMFKHPKSLTQFLPIYWHRKKGFVYDFNLIVMYLIMSFVFATTFYLGGKYL